MQNFKCFQQFKFQSLKNFKHALKGKCLTTDKGMEKEFLSWYAIFSEQIHHTDAGTFLPPPNLSLFIRNIGMYKLPISWLIRITICFNALGYLFQNKPFEIWGSHGSEYVNCGILVCEAMQFAKDAGNTFLENSCTAKSPLFTQFINVF
jgi:hypothetical protein